MIELIVGIGIGLVLLIAVICAFAWYRIVDPSESHLVATPRKVFVVSPDPAIATEGKRSYFEIPSWLPFFGRAVRIMDMTIRERVVTQETYEKGQARYMVRSSTKFRIIDVAKAAERFVDSKELNAQLEEIINASVRTVTQRYNVVEARANKQVMSDEIFKEMQDDFAAWGLKLENFQLVDFQDTEDSSIISDISRIREVEINSDKREKNAEKIKQALVKEAAADEAAKQRQIERDRVIGEQEQIKKQMIAEKEKIAQEKAFAVIQVQTIKQAEIDKEKAIVEANQAKETESIMKDKKKLEGEGDRDRAVEQAKGAAAPIREKGFAEAEAKEKLQLALNKFEDKAIRALVAEKIVEMQQTVGVATAGALKEADLRIFAGDGEHGKAGFDLGKLIESASVSGDLGAAALANRIARPGDMGLVNWNNDTAKSETK